MDPQYDCQNGVENFQQLWSHSKQTWCCSHFNSGCGHWEKADRGWRDVTYNKTRPLRVPTTIDLKDAGGIATCKTRSVFHVRWSMCTTATTAKPASPTGTMAGPATRRTRFQARNWSRSNKANLVANLYIRSMALVLLMPTKNKKTFANRHVAV